MPLGGTGSPLAPLIDGVLADGTGFGVGGSAVCYGPRARISVGRCDALVAAKSLMVRQLQALLNATNGGVVLGNGFSWYSYPNGSPDHNAFTLADMRGIMNEHTAVFEDILPSGKLNITTMVAMLAAIKAAGEAGKVVVLAAWPGPLVGFGADGNPAWPGGTQPKSIAEWKPVMLQKHAFAIALLCTVITPTTYLQYELWYNGWPQGALPCDDDPSSCVSPASSTWYPDLYKPLGAPLGDATRLGNVWTRKFARATSTLDLDNPDASGVAFF